MTRAIYTKWFQRVRLAMRLTRHDVVEIMQAGGVSVSSSRADGWMRSRDREDDRMAVMSEAEFDAFTSGLAEWSRHSRTGASRKSGAGDTQ